MNQQSQDKQEDKQPDEYSPRVKEKPNPPHNISPLGEVGHGRLTDQFHAGR